MDTIKWFCLCMFAIGIAIMAEYVGFNPWWEEHLWVAFLMALTGGIGILILWGRKD